MFLFFFSQLSPKRLTIITSQYDDGEAHHMYHYAHWSNRWINTIKRYVNVSSYHQFLLKIQLENVQIIIMRCFTARGKNRWFAKVNLFFSLLFSHNESCNFLDFYFSTASQKRRRTSNNGRIGRKLFNDHLNESSLFAILLFN